MSLLSDLPKLAELGNIPPLTVEGNCILYPDGDEAAKCRPNLGDLADNWLTGEDLATSACALLNATPAMLSVLGKFREGDEYLSRVILRYCIELFENGEPSNITVAAMYGKDERMIECLRRLQEACKLMEA